MTRKPISVVKSVLHQNCTAVAKDEHLIIVKSNSTFCDWAPFNSDNWSALFGNLDLVYLLGYAISMFISGHIAERVNIRYFLSLGMLLCGFTTSLFGLGHYLNMHQYWYYVLVQTLAGIVQAVGWPCVVACMGNWFGKSKRGFLMGLWNSHTSLGNIFGAIIAASFVEYNWGLSFIVPGSIIAGFGIVVFFFLVPYPEDVGCHSRKSQKNQMLGSIHSAAAITYCINSEPNDRFSDDSSGMQQKLLDDEEVTEEASEHVITFFGAFLIPGVIEYSLCLFFAKLVSYTFLFWLPSYIKSAGGFDPAQAADLSAIMDGGGILGGIIAGLINDITGASAITCSSMLILAVPYLYFYSVYGVLTLTNCIVMLVFLGVLVNGPYALITTAVSADLGTHECLRGNSRAIATVTAIIDGTGSLGAALGPLITGMLVKYGWIYVFIMLMVATALAVLLLSRRVYKEIKHVYNKRKENKYNEFDCDD